MKAKVTISRGSDDKVRISFEDAASHIEFATVSLSPEAFGHAVTGLSMQEGELEVRGLEFVGRRRITERRQIVCPIKSYDKSVLTAWLNENAQEEGWLLSTYLGSQSSVSHVEGGTLLRYSVTKYVSD